MGQWARPSPGRSCLIWAQVCVLAAPLLTQVLVDGLGKAEKVGPMFVAPTVVGYLDEVSSFKVLRNWSVKPDGE